MNGIDEKVVLSADTCRYLIDTFESDKVTKVTRDKQYGNCGQEGIVKHEYVPDEIFNLLEGYGLKPIEFTNIVNVFMVRRYNVGDSFPEHRDNNTLNYTSTNSGREHRYRTFIFQLSEEGTYQGGNLKFEEYTAGSELGNCIYFDANLPHYVTEVTSGVRYTALFWVRNTDFINYKKLL